MQLAYKSYGTGRPLIILHGLLGASDNWHTLSSKVFGEAFQVFAVDQRNHGQSPHSDVFDYPALVEDLNAFMRSQQLTTTHLLGHSMGGKAAMHYALTYPEQVDRLIVVDIAPRAYPARHQEIFDALRALDLKAYTARRDIDEALAERIDSTPVRHFLLKNLSFDRDKGYRWKMNLEGIYSNYAAINAAVETGRTFEGPALFVRGGRSDYITYADEPAIRALFPRAEVETIAGAGHWVHAEQPKAFAERVMTFLQRA